MPSGGLISKPLFSPPTRFLVPWINKPNLLSLLHHSTAALAHSPRLTKDTTLSPLIESITTLASLRRLPEAFAAFSLLRLHSPSSHLLFHPTHLLLASAADLRSIPSGEQLHAFSISFGLFHRISFLCLLTSFYISTGLLPPAAAIAEESPYALPWKLLISAYVRAGFSGEALAAYHQMFSLGVVPDCFTYPSLLKACGDAGDLELGREIHRSIESSGIGFNLFVTNALVAMYLKCGELDVARKLFDEMPERDVVSWNSIISGYASRGLWKEAFELFERAMEGCSEVNSVTWNTIIGGLLQKGDHVKALKFVSQMRLSKSGVDFVTFVIGLNACSRIGMLRLGKEIHGLAVRLVYDDLESVRNALITMYSRCRDIGTAHLLLQMIKNPSLITWNAMLAGFAIEDRAEEASLLFRKILHSGLQPNYVTVVTILALCARVANLQHGRELHCYIAKHEFGGHLLLWNSLVDMYSKSGRISAARRVFDAMADHDEVSYTSLIAGYGMQGEGSTAVQLFDEMISCGIKPDHVSMVAVLTACSHSRLVSRGETLFNKMESTFGIKPKMEHFSCMVDLYARAGLLEKAEEVINKVPFRPTSAMWSALVGACQVYRNTEIGAKAAMRLLEMKTDNAGHYVLIANMYAAANWWGELAKVRRLMRDEGVRKAPGCAWADLGNGFMPFVVGDRSSPVSPDIYEVLEGLAEQMSDEAFAISVEFVGL
ncbi:pentatricopeptide repeat-containing protein At1g71490 [Phalaenopsis equestris]|uniref:pentatricopeptide repeat-containing protein At1g71490 n=1 Tax=Phalaenopsis equestris TaxID=78828 RepID=UPI0009E3BAF7|nr:pentatricopeptide repeat-containing protein At1g71490 [Phalaenopsis equestris]